MTIYSPRTDSDYYSMEDLIVGIYFKSENDISTEYLIELCEGRYEGNALVKIYTIETPSNHFCAKGLINGSEIEFPEYDAEWIAEVDLCGKYFFPKFNNELQLYYDDAKYYKDDSRENWKTDQIASLMESINFAIEYGLKKSGIVPY